MPLAALLLPSHEDPDWGYARNTRTVLMVPSAEWVQSTFSCTFAVGGSTFIAPNRDSPYEGLLVHQNGENWKLIDCIGVALRTADGRVLSLARDTSASAVQVDPWQATYRYAGQITNGDGREQEVPFSVTYRLHSASPPEQRSGSIELAIPHTIRRAIGELVVSFQPLLDIRHMYAGSEPCGHQVELEDRGARVRVTNRDRSLVFHLPPGEVTVFSRAEVLSWWYKLGAADRIERVDPERRRAETVFRGERRDVVAVFRLDVRLLGDADAVRIGFVSGGTGSAAAPPLDAIHEASLRLDRAQLEGIERAFAFPADLPYRDAIVSRIVGLTKFKLRLPRLGAGEIVDSPYAGAWWFKTPWYRDVFEGILSSFRTLMALHEERRAMKDVLRLALSLQDEATGLIPNRLPEFIADAPSYNSTDATLLCFIAAYTYLKEVPDESFAREVERAAWKMIVAFRRSGSLPPRIDGPPRLHAETGLLLSAPHHSWIDTRARRVEHHGGRLEGLPSRLSERFVQELLDRSVDQGALGAELSSARFFLPEINAQWIVALRWIAQASGEELAGEAASILARAEHCYLSTFWNEDAGFLFNMVHEDGVVRDAIECEAAVTAAGMLGATLFTRDRLLAIWRRVEETLLVQRRLVRYGSDLAPFGIAVKNDESRLFYGDDEYHGSVVWPRSTPYLIGLLRALDLQEPVRGLVVNALDHQMTEGAVFYNHELFALPLGRNPAPDPISGGNPVPVKNPIQFWSQWCDPMVDTFGRRMP